LKIFRDRINDVHKSVFLPPHPSTREEVFSQGTPLAVRKAVPDLETRFHFSICFSALFYL
jgi:hypothetical protein